MVMTSNLGSHHFREMADPEKARPLGLAEIAPMADIPAAHLRRQPRDAVRADAAGGVLTFPKMVEAVAV
jgi:hypothetical protein